jgi:two-component system sensor histidine kinase MprB
MTEPGGRRRWSGLSLRSKLALVAAIPVALAISVAVSVAYAETRHELRGQLDSQLRHQASELQQQAAFAQGQGFPVVRLRPEFGQPGGYIQVVRGDGLLNQPDGQPVLPAGNRDRSIASDQRNGSFRDTHVGDVSVRMLTAPLAVVNGTGYAVQVALPLTAVNGQLNRLATAFTVLALGAFAVAIFMVWWLTRRALRPVAQLTEAAEEIATTKDLTHRIDDTSGDELGRLASSFNSMLDALERSLGVQRQLVTDASHELRTPLASLRTNSEVLREFDRLEPNQREELVAGIVSQVDELTGLVADVVELARGEAQPGALENISFDDLVAHAVDRARRYWPNLIFQLDLDPAVVRGVPTRLDRAVANLLDNAGKFSPPGGEVEVSLSAQGVLTVADHGPGVPDDALEHVFDRFYRADEARSMPGSGLGLSIVKQVVDGLGGTISLSNRPAGGALARMVLPVVGQPESGTAEALDSAGAVEPVG